MASPVKRRGGRIVRDRPCALDHRSGRRVAETHAHLADLAGSAGDRLDLIDGDPGLLGGELRGVHRVVAEVLGPQAVLFKTYQLVARDAFRIEAHLHLHVLRGRAEGARELSGEVFVPTLAHDVVAAVAVAREFG
jgi:hypothetical protein